MADLTLAFEIAAEGVVDDAVPRQAAPCERRVGQPQKELGFSGGGARIRDRAEDGPKPFQHRAEGREAQLKAVGCLGCHGRAPIDATSSLDGNMASTGGARNDHDGMAGMRGGQGS